MQEAEKTENKEALDQPDNKEEGESFPEFEEPEGEEITQDSKEEREELLETEDPEEEESSQDSEEGEEIPEPEGSEEEDTSTEQANEKDLEIIFFETDEEGNPLVQYQKDRIIPGFQLLDKDKNILEAGIDYTIQIKENQYPGFVDLQVIGKGNYVGYSYKTLVKIIPGNLVNATMKIKDKKYSQKADQWKAAVEIRDVNGRRLGIEKDYSSELEYFYDNMEQVFIPPVGTVVTVTAYGKNNYEGSQVSSNYRIVQGNINDLQIYTGEPVAVEFFELNSTWVEGMAGTVYQMEIGGIQPQNANLLTPLWSSSDEKVVTVDGSGLLFLKQPGVVTITVTFPRSEYKAMCRVRVKEEEENLQSGIVNLSDYQKLGDENANQAFERAMDALENMDGNTLYVPAGTYEVDAEKKVKLRSDMKLMMSPDAVIKALPNSNENYEILSLEHVSNVQISGGRIVGERYRHGNDRGEWGMGICLRDSKNIIISDVHIADCWGDGIYIGSTNDDNILLGSENVTVVGCTLDNNRRNNLSIVNGDNIVIDNCIIQNANGTLPEGGIDIEANNSDNPCENITISNTLITGNAGLSLGVGTWEDFYYPGDFIGSSDNITVSNCILNGYLINVAGTNMVISNSQINGHIDARIPMTMVNGTQVNAGSEVPDTLVASFDAGEDNFSVGSFDVNALNKMKIEYRENMESPTGKVLYMERTTKGDREAGGYFNFSDILQNGSAKLIAGSTYRFEYTIRGTGHWGVKSDKTGWYYCVPQQDKFSTGYTYFEAIDNGSPYRMIFFARSLTKGMNMEIASIYIYEVN